MVSVSATLNVIAAPALSLVVYDCPLTDSPITTDFASVPAQLNAVNVDLDVISVGPDTFLV